MGREIRQARASEKKNGAPNPVPKVTRSLAVALLGLHWDACHFFAVFIRYDDVAGMVVVAIVREFRCDGGGNRLCRVQSRAVLADFVDEFYTAIGNREEIPHHTTPIT